MQKKIKTLEDFKSWAKQNGFIYPSSEIYGGFAAVYDYGHYGFLLKRNIENLWWKAMLWQRDDVYALDAGIYMHPKTWVASGHVAGFDDVLVEDTKTNKRYRADQLIEEWFDKKGEKVDMDKKTPAELAEIITQNNIKSPDGNEVTTPRSFNLMVKTNLGSTDNSFTEENVTYLRGETCQAIYLEYLNYINTMRAKLPFGIAQVGKAFRNEIVARQFIFRTREFEQMEMQYFHHPDDKKAKFEMWKQARMDWYTNILQIPADKLRFKEHSKLIFYATAAFDVEYDFDSLGGFKEIEGIHDRGDYDLTQHSKFSGQKLDYFDQERNQRYTPHIMETSAGLTRILMMVLEENLVEQEITNAKGEKDLRTVLKVNKALAPVKVAVLPLSRDAELIAKAKEVKALIHSNWITEYDDTASIGKRYRRQDEVGTPYCVTIDFDTMQDQAVTVRDRDTMAQERIKIDELSEYLNSKLS